MKYLSGNIILDTRSKVGIEFASLVSVTNKYNVPITPNCGGDLRRIQRDQADNS